jgi:Cu/Ag efflux protein CusF
MTIPKMMSAGVVAVAMMGSAALAQQSHSGMVTEINRLNDTISIRQTQDGTVGSGTNMDAEQFKVQSGVSLEALHAGDRVSFSTSGGDGAKTITKLDRQSN